MDGQLNALLFQITGDKVSSEKRKSETKRVKCVQSRKNQSKEAGVKEGLLCFAPDSVTMRVAPVPLALPVLGQGQVP